MSLVSQAIETHLTAGTHRSIEANPGRIDFSSNDYLGLSNCQKIRSHLIGELEAGCPLGATGSRLLSGHTEYHERVESFLAQTFEVSSALIFSSGFMANLGVISTLGSLGATFFSDEFNHASLVDGIRFSKSTKEIFKHNDLNHLEELLIQSASDLKVIITESVFSMDGDLAPICELIKLADEYNAWLVVDEAHATGIFGSRGLGRLEQFESKQNQLISIHTGGKALGGQGAFVLCDAEFRKLLINRSRSFIFSTALSPLSVLQIEYALREILDDPKRGSELVQKAFAWKNSLPGEFETLQSSSPIVPVVLGSNEKAIQISNRLKDQGFDVKAIRFPTVPKGSERLRVTIKTFHTQNELSTLAHALRELNR